MCTEKLYKYKLLNIFINKKLCNIWRIFFFSYC